MNILIYVSLVAVKVIANVVTDQTSDLFNVRIVSIGNSEVITPVQNIY